MQHEIPSFKECPNCNTEKSSEEFYRNSSRKDGLTYVCIACIHDYSLKEKKPKRVLSTIFKTCSSCQRNLSSRMYVYSQKTEDHLKETCRTCSSFRGKKNPTKSQIELYESTLQNLITEGLKLLDPEKNRSEFEQFVWKGLKSHRLLEEWKPPIWIHKTSIPE